MDKTSLEAETAKRVRSLAKENNVPLKELQEFLYEKLTNAGAQLKMSTILSWFRGYYHFSIGALILIADRFDVSVGYLLGEHNIKEITITPDKNFNSRVDKASKEYMKTHKMTKFPLKEASLSGAWFWKYRNNPCTLGRPDQFLRLSKYMKYSIDYVLGIADFKYWEVYAFEHGHIQDLPDETIFRVPTGKGGKYGFLNKEKELIVLSDGLFIPIEIAHERGATIVVEAFTSDSSRI